MTPIAAAIALVDELHAMKRISSADSEKLHRGLRVAEGTTEARDWLMPADFTVEGLRSWLLNACEMVGCSPTVLARAAGLSPSTVNRFLEPEREGSLSGSTIFRLISAIQLQVMPDGEAEHLVDTRPTRPNFARRTRIVFVRDGAVTSEALAAGLATAVEAAGTATALAQALGVSVQAVSQWEMVPPLRVLEVERLTGVPRHVIRPDLYPAQPESEPA